MGNSDYINIGIRGVERMWKVTSIQHLHMKEQPLRLSICGYTTNV